MVIFSAGLTKNLSLSSKPVIFDKVFVDIKRSYNSTSGYFVAPVSGYYEFNYHGLGEKGSTLRLNLMHQGRFEILLVLIVSASKPVIWTTQVNLHHLNM